MAHWLGVDGGGTKTAFVLLGDDGAEQGVVEGSSSYHLEHGMDRVEQVLVEGVAAVTAQAGITPADVDHAFFALPGHGESSHDTPLLDRLPAVALGHDRYRCGNDTVAGWAGSLGGEDGVNIVAGTGSITYGERRGHGVRVGGWGELFSDEGSAYWIGLEALTAFSRMSDGRAPRTLLHERIRTVAEVEDDLDLVDVVFRQWGRSRGRIAALAPTVTRAAEDGDATATAILDRAATELVELVEATARQLGFAAGESVPVSWSGGVFHAEAVRSRFAALLDASVTAYDLRAPRFSSHVGAALYAAKTAGHPLDPAALARLAPAGMPS
ncbi:N-acetylglucosamine kinase [Curtobacterium sp. MCBD17_028]|uniref:N-acetylglucosamine kinase n=1 Tax=Curtobacterium sp. MCBD17_028 TaxID=2175670 RepID=UPI000DA88662|nr:BadF/BadG/BcrA/BcrD ATPase family protein [Curtobacterium sp. MCBD17_028]PZE30075.1 N-acetylglucosamine kinase [Curtobacterium sp. MCBD17_028]